MRDTVQVGDKKVKREEHRHRHRLVGHFSFPGSPSIRSGSSNSTGALELPRGAQAHGRHRRRSHRTGARFGVAPARRSSHHRRVPRPNPARLRRRRPQGSQQDLQEAGTRDSACRRRSRKPSARATRSRSPSSLRPAGKPKTIEADVVLVAVGRRPTPKGSGSTSPDVNSTNRASQSKPITNSDQRPGHLCNRRRDPRAMLAHKAEDEGIAVAEKITEQAGR